MTASALVPCLSQSVFQENEYMKNKHEPTIGVFIA